MGKLIYKREVVLLDAARGVRVTYSYVGSFLLRLCDQPKQTAIVFNLN